MEAVINLVLYHTLAIHTPTRASIIEVSQPNPLIHAKINVICAGITAGGTVFSGPGSIMTGFSSILTASWVMGQKVTHKFGQRVSGFHLPF
jgi:hypothetical protein